MLTNREFYIQSLRDHLYYLRDIKDFCITIALSFYKNNVDYINITNSFLEKSSELVKMALSYTDGFISKEALDNQIYVTDYTLPCERLTEKLFGIDINTSVTEEELNLKEGINQNIDNELIENIKKLNQMALTFAKNFKDFCDEIRIKIDNNELFSFSYRDFFSYLFDEVNTYIQDLERIIQMESFSPIYAASYEYDFATTLQKTARFIRDWVDVSYKDVYDIATYYVNSFGEIIDSYLKASLSPDVQGRLSKIINNLLADYQNFLRDILGRLIEKKLYFITPPVSIDNIYTSINFYKFVLDQSSKEA